MKKLATLLIVGGVLASGCGDDGSGDGDIAAFCDAVDRLEHSGDPWDHVDDRDAFVAAVDEQAAAMADARSSSSATDQSCPTRKRSTLATTPTSPQSPSEALASVLEIAVRRGAHSVRD